MITKMKESELSKSVGNSVDIKRHIETQRESIKYLQTHYSELLEQYRNKWIVIRNNEIVGVEDTPKQLRNHFEKTKERDVFLYFLADPEDMLIL